MYIFTESEILILRYFQSLSRNVRESCVCVCHRGNLAGDWRVFFKELAWGGSVAVAVGSKTSILSNTCIAPICHTQAVPCQYSCPSAVCIQPLWRGWS